MDLGNTNLFHKGFCTVLFSSNEQNAGTLPHIAQQIHVFLLKTKGKKFTKENYQKESVFGIIASEISTQVHKVTTGCR